MSAGTITLTNGSAVVGGTGTSFTTELAAGDFIVSTVGGVPYTLPVKTVDSNTQLTLVSNFTGPTQTGAAWSAVPRVALNMVTAALVAQSAEALRGLNYDKQNWQQVYSAAGNITVKLPDGTTFTGPSWKYLSDNMATKSGGAVPVNQGGTGSTTAAGARTNLGLVDGSGLIPVSIGGTGAKTAADARSNIGALSSTPAKTGAGGTGERVQHAAGNGLFNLDMFNCYWYMQPEDTNFWIAHAVSYAGNGGVASGYGRVIYAIRIADGTIKYVQCRTDKNTTVDANGFIKSASPIVNIYANGRFETNDESEGVSVSRQDVGEYLITGCLGLNADASWGGSDGGFEIPVDRNKQPRLWLNYKVNSDGSILMKTYHRVHSTAPDFAQNRIGVRDENGCFTETVKDGDPVDIPSDTFVSVRVEMPASSI
ncbi:phage tail protein [Enterobacter roggenkampii]|uniref:phage tail fiber protein n=1 Tax=Enterobacter roggenkampii TaxID=1812935 RepID=UPI0025ABE609|nr:phage tail protein [Enterobacter roggenkampii]WJS52850.1 phage tail protein [Enterobacter roggenkampii]